MCSSLGLASGIHALLELLALNEGIEELGDLALGLGAKAAERVALWYGDDVADLEPVHDVEALSRIVREGMSSSVEVYAMFIRQ